MERIQRPISPMCSLLQLSAGSSDSHIVSPLPDRHRRPCFPFFRLPLQRRLFKKMPNVTVQSEESPIMFSPSLLVNNLGMKSYFNLIGKTWLYLHLSYMNFITWKVFSWSLSISNRIGFHCVCWMNAEWPETFCGKWQEVVLWNVSQE